MSLCYRTDGRKATVRVKGPPSPDPADVKKIPSFHSTMSSKRKSHSVSSASTLSSLRSVFSDSEKEKEKKAYHQSTKPLPSQARRPSTKPLPSRLGRPGTKPQPSQEHDKEKVKINENAKNASIAQKQREFINFRKQFMQQQNAYIDMYAQLRDLEERSGVPAGSAGEVRLLSVTEWPAHDLLLLAQNTTAQPHKEMKGILGPKILQQLSCQLTGIPEEAMALATELMQRRFELLEYIRSALHNDRLTYEGKRLEWQIKNAELDEETEKLRKLVVTTVKSFESKIIHSLDVAKIPWIDRDNMIKKIESLQKELSIYKTNKPDESVKTATEPNMPDEPVKTNTATNTLALAESVKTPTATDHKKVLEELSKERAARAAMKEAAAAAEVKAATARARCMELERQLHDTKVELASAQRRLDNLRQLHHYRASNFESHSKKLEKVSKNGEVTIEVLSRQRDALELRVRELQEQATAKARDAETRENQLTCRIESLRSKLEQQESRSESLEVQMQESQKRFKELQDQFHALQERSRELINIQHQKCIEYLPRKVQCSGEELEIWNDLQATKDALVRVKEELELSRADKDSLLNSLAKIAQEGPNENKLAEELLSRERKINKMRNNIEDLTEKKRTMEESLACYENQLAALRMEVGVLRCLNSYESFDQGLPHEELEREVFNLGLQVQSLKRERAALVTEAATRALMLERHERCAELFAQVTRARRELAAQLEGNPVQSVFEGAPIHEVADSLSKAYLTSADIWSALRAERSHVLRLENTILAQNHALDRDSVVRLEHERKRAQLERELIRTWAGNEKCLKPENKEVEVCETLY